MIEAQAPIPGDSAWISPDGKFYPVDYATHHDFAAAMCAERGYEHAGERPVVYLEQLGWLHVSGGHFHRTGKFTQRQLDTVFDWYVVCDAAGHDMAKHAKDFIGVPLD